MFFHSNNFFFSYSVLNVNSLECVSVNNEKCKIRSKIISVKTDEPMFHLMKQDI